MTYDGQKAMASEIAPIPPKASKISAFVWTNIRSKESWVVFVAGAAVLFNFYFLSYGLVTSYQLKGLFMVFAFTLMYLLTMPKTKSARIFSTIILLMAIAGPIWLIASEPKLIANFYTATQAEVYVFLVTLVGLTALTLRTIGGVVIVVMMLAATLYMFFGHYIPGAFGHGYLPPTWVASTLFTNLYSGMFGSLTELGARLISIFMIFACLLLVSGLGDFFIAIAQRLFGGMTGGPAKAAVMGSAMFGMISGSAVSNVSATGSFTIPMMKKVGYPPIVAASVESVASTGGSLMPPIMGLAAFIMAELVGVPYFHIIILAIIPAFLWYYSTFLIVHSTAHRERIQRWRPPLAETQKVLKDTWHVALAIPVLIAALVYFTQAQYAAFYSVIALIGLTFLRKGTRLTKARIAEFLRMYAKVYIPLFIMVVALDTFLGASLGTGIHLKIGYLLMSGIDQWYVALTLVFVICVILGMVAPHPATYVAVVAIAAPALVGSFHFDLLQVHMFIFYGGLLANLTPPVCLPVFVAASIAGSPLMKTGWFTAMRSIPLWIIPFAILRNSLFFGVGTPLASLGLGVAILAYGIFIFTMGSTGFFRGNLTWLERALAMAIGLMIIQPFFTNPIILGASSLAGVAFIIYRILISALKSKKAPI